MLQRTAHWLLVPAIPALMPAARKPSPAQPSPAQLSAARPVQASAAHLSSSATSVSATVSMATSSPPVSSALLMALRLRWVVYHTMTTISTPLRKGGESGSPEARADVHLEAGLSVGSGFRPG